MKWTPEEIKRRRAERGLSQSELGRLLADVLGENEPIARRTITNWENGHAEPRGRNLHALDQVLASEPNADDIPLSRASFMQLLAELARRYAELDASPDRPTAPDPSLGNWTWPGPGAPSARRRENDQGVTPRVEFRPGER